MDAEKLYLSVESAKAKINKLESKLLAYKTRVVQLDREVAQRDRLMEKYILNSEQESGLQSKCLI